MAKKTSKHTGEHIAPEERINDALNQTESWIQRNVKTLLTVLIVAVVVVGGFFAYRSLIVAPRAEKASQAMFVAEQLFAEGDYDMALEGDGKNAGFLEVVETYGSTKPGRLAAHYAGICYMKKGEPDTALEYLEKYKSVNGAPGAIINAQNFGLRGDIAVDKGDYAGALSLYGKAIAAADNSMTTPYYLRKSALTMMETGDFAGALDACERIKSEFASSMEANDIDKLIGQIEQQIL